MWSSRQIYSFILLLISHRLSFTAGESAGLRAAFVGDNEQTHKSFLLHGALYCMESGQRVGRGKRALENSSNNVISFKGQEATEKLKGIKYADDYSDEGYILSSADCLGMTPSGMPCIEQHGDFIFIWSSISTY